jgi:hypothetical protein
MDTRNEGPDDVARQGRRGRAVIRFRIDCQETALNRDMVARDRRFLVALSFPGEVRPYVRSVADSLAQELGREKVFFDEYYEAELAVLNLDLKLQKIYRDESDLVVPFFCKDYAEKRWCKVEWDAIRAAIFSRRKDDAVMAIRFDRTEIDGFLETAGYISVNNRRPDEIAALILKRVKDRPSDSSHQVHEHQGLFIDIEPPVIAPMLPIQRIKDLGRKMNIPEKSILDIVTRPRPTAKVLPFRIAKYCVTNEEYWAYVKEKAMVDWPSHWDHQLKAQYGFPFVSDIAKYPVTNISFEEAKNYCVWKDARLPTSTEWEYAALGHRDFFYPWGNDFSADHCNCREHGSNSLCCVDDFRLGDTQSGIRQMAGNVWEMTIGTGSKPELRGGSYRSMCEFWGGHMTFRVQDRQTRAPDIGFRVVTHL